LGLGWLDRLFVRFTTAFSFFVAAANAFKMTRRQKAQPATRKSQRLAKQPTPTQSTLPPELWTMIFAYLSVSELCAAKEVCRYWRHNVSFSPLRAKLSFHPTYFPLNGRCIIENDKMRVCIDQVDTLRDTIEYLAPEFALEMHVRVQPSRDGWDVIPLDYPQFDTIRQLVFDRSGFNVTLVLTPSDLTPSRFSARLGIPLAVEWDRLDRDTLKEHHEGENVEYLSEITALRLGYVEDDARLRKSLAYMPNIAHAYVRLSWRVDLEEFLDIGLDVGFDTLPNLRNLVISYEQLTRKTLNDIKKMRHLEYLQLYGVADQVDLDALSDMFANSPRLWFLHVFSLETYDWIHVFRKDKVRRAMRHLKHVIISNISPSSRTGIMADFIEALSHLENIERITVCLDTTSGFGPKVGADVIAACLSAGRDEARIMRSARLRIDVI
jgi:hypothetical protein